LLTLSRDVWSEVVAPLCGLVDEQRPLFMQIAACLAFNVEQGLRSLQQANRSLARTEPRLTISPHCEWLHRLERPLQA
jgi:hypothetical protein